jgi:hypothetical protein
MLLAILLGVPMEGAFFPIIIFINRKPTRLNEPAKKQEACMIGSLLVCGGGQLMGAILPLPSQGDEMVLDALLACSSLID